ncbi:MFS transporter [Caldalkalibacillus salinus]|uniref:MFS transporter n=1 Tax=Caldalkalibacillus salinus TaxID=2803787 RepID=UPI001F3CA9C3|nr:MFS transporter [Caldalkalibacillus salinus]
MKCLRLTKDKSLSEQAWVTLANHAMYQFGHALSLIFINLYLWRLTNDVYINALYNLIALLTQAVATICMGKMAKQKDRLIVYRYGICLTAVFYLCIVMAQENIVSYYAFFALLKGVAQACYWLGYFTLVYDFSTNRNRHRYLGWNQIIMGTANLIAPALAGIVISTYQGLSGYILVFTIAFFMFLLATLGSLRMKQIRTHHKTYYMSYLPQMLHRKPQFSKTLLGWLIVGFPQGILMFIPPILLFNIVQQEHIVGYLNVCFLSLSIVSSYLISRIANLESTLFYLCLSTFGFISSSLWLLWDIALWTVVLFMATHALFKPLQANTYAAYYFKWIEWLPLRQHFKVESVVLRESIINLGRAMGIVLFMFIVRDSTTMLPVVIVAVMGLQMIIPILVKNASEEGEDEYQIKSTKTSI